MAYQLPRSLVPLPDESLPGYLLRLSHRVGLPPARILQLTGLAGGNARFPSRISHEPMIRMTPAALAAFTQATRLDETEADALGLHSFLPRYPIPDTTTGGSTFLQRADWWIFSTASRYCPDCLAGDGSAIESAHGGAWRRSWRLPVVFACTRHQRLLSHSCPDCHRPAFGVTAGTARIPLIPALKASGLHPAQCRASDSKGNSGMTRKTISVCGARLDIPGDRTAAPSVIISLQERLTALLDPAGPQSVTSAAHPAEPARYFTDLRVLAVLISHSWPRARHLLPVPALADAIGRHVAREEAERDQLSGRQQPPPVQTAALARPLDPAAGAGLLLIADRILCLPGLPEIQDALQPLIQADGKFAYRLAKNLGLLGGTRQGCSPGLAKAAVPLVRVFPRRGLKASRAPELASQLAPENIPALLPEKYCRHLPDAGNINPRLVRRTASVRLVQMIAGGAMATAADFLGTRIRVDKNGHRTFDANKVLERTGSRRGEFGAALEKITAEIIADGRLINYKHRRDTLQDWAVSPENWQHMLRSIPVPPNARRRLGERERQWASVIVWTEITQGEYQMAPRPIRDQQPAAIQRQWRLAGHPTGWVVHLASSAAPHPKFYLALREILDAYAAELGTRIDDTAPPLGDAAGQLALTAQAN